MSKDLVIYGPYTVTFKKAAKGNSKQITADDVNSFWKSSAHSHILKKQGVYIFALKAGRGYCPWYVGKATATFSQEALHTSKLVKYNEVLFDGQKGTPVMFFVAPPKALNKVPSGICDEVETMLIQAAYTENTLIKNRQKTKIPSWTIQGVVRKRPGPVSEHAQVFRKMMGLGKGKT